MIANILSLDMDWFNCFERCTLKYDIDIFFHKLSQRCIVPKIIDIIPEHHYLFPWGLGLLKKLSCKKVNILNIDEHHDFFHLHEIDFSASNSQVTCANFFAFMVDRRIINNYTWISLASTLTGTKRDFRALRGDFRSANSKIVQDFYKKVKVRSRHSVYRSLYKRCDGFIIVRSPKYTLNHRSVCHAVDLALETYFHDRKVNRHSCRRDYQQGHVSRMSRRFILA